MHNLRAGRFLLGSLMFQILGVLIFLFVSTSQSSSDGLAYYENKLSYRPFLCIQPFYTMVTVLYKANCMFHAYCQNILSYLGLSRFSVMKMSFFKVWCDVVIQSLAITTLFNNFQQSSVPYILLWLTFGYGWI